MALGLIQSHPQARVLLLFLLVIVSSGSQVFAVAAEADEPPPAKFGDTIQVLGQMERTDQDFADGLALDLFSPTNRTLVVTNNTKPLGGQFVTGSTGEGFMALSNYSWVVKMNETAADLIAKVELPYDPAMLATEGVAVANTYVGMLAADGKSWVVDESKRNVHFSENKTRVIKMTSVDGEYMLLGRRSVDTSNIFVQYGQGATRTLNLTGGPGVQEAEFVDGLRVSIEAASAFTMNVDIPHGIVTQPGANMSLNSFAWVMNTTGAPAGTTANVKFPFNSKILAAKTPEAKPQQLKVARQALNESEAAPFAVLEDQELVDGEDSIRVKGVKELDGRYILMLA